MQLVQSIDWFVDWLDWFDWLIQSIEFDLLIRLSDAIEKNNSLPGKRDYNFLVPAPIIIVSSSQQIDSIDSSDWFDCLDRLIDSIDCFDWWMRFIEWIDGFDWLTWLIRLIDSIDWIRFIDSIDWCDWFDYIFLVPATVILIFSSRQP